MQDKRDIADTVEHSVDEAPSYTVAKEEVLHGGRAVDDALRFVLEHDEVTWTESEEKRVRWKIDMVVLPLLFLAATLGQGDLQAYGFAAIFGLVKDLKLYSIKTGNGSFSVDLSKYSFTAGFANLGAAAGQWPLLVLAQYFSYGKFSGMMVFYAGCLSLLTIVCHDFSEIMALRFFTGIATVVSPLAIIITSMWWKTNEQPLRVGTFIAGAALGNLVGQGIDFGAISLRGAYAASPWKWIYVVLGSVTMGYGVIVVLLLPASPMKSWFLSPRERLIAVRRLARNNTGIQTRSFKMKQLIEAFTDPQFYLLGIYSWSFAFVNSALGSFGGYLVTSFGYTPRQALLLAMPASAIAAVSMFLSGLLGTMFPKRRILLAMLFILPSIVGSIVLWKAPRDNEHALLAGLYISTTFYGALVQEFALLTGNISGHTKKTTINAALAILTNLGGFAGPWAYHGNEAAKGYPTGQKAALSLLCASEAAFAVLWAYYVFRNKKKTHSRVERPELVSDPMLSFGDLTDQENPVFQYVH